MTCSPFPWRLEEDRANPRYQRVHDRNGQSIARVYYPGQDADLIALAPELRAFVGMIADGEGVSRTYARELASRAGHKVK